MSSSCAAVGDCDLQVSRSSLHCVHEHGEWSGALLSSTWGGKPTKKLSQIFNFSLRFKSLAAPRARWSLIYLFFSSSLHRFCLAWTTPEIYISNNVILSLVVMPFSWQWGRWPIWPGDRARWREAFFAVCVERLLTWWETFSVASDLKSASRIRPIKSTEFELLVNRFQISSHPHSLVSTCAHRSNSAKFVLQMCRAFWNSRLVCRVFLDL